MSELPQSPPIDSILASNTRLETELDPLSLVAVTSTFYPDWYPGKLLDSIHTGKVRGDAAIGTFISAKQHGFQMIVVDGGSCREFIEELEVHGIASQLQEEKGLGPARRQGLLAASQLSGAEFLYLLEPEKTSLVESMPDIAQTMRLENVDIAVPAREPTLFHHTYPDYQYGSESDGNGRINRFLHKKGITLDDQNFDWFFGPKVIRNVPEVVALFMRKYEMIGEWPENLRGFSDPERYGNALWYPVFNALLDPNFKVITVEVPFEYPSIQKENEMRNAATDILRRQSQKLGLLLAAREFYRFIMQNQPEMKQLSRLRRNTS